MIGIFVKKVELNRTVHVDEIENVVKISKDQEKKTVVVEKTENYLNLLDYLEKR